MTTSSNKAQHGTITPFSLPGISINVETITPEIATDLLSRNENNRKPTESHYLSLVNDMREGRFIFNGDPIRIGQSGNLLDGQHRLLAIQKAKIPQKMLVVRGIKDEAMPTIDVGKKRTLGEILHLTYGVKNAVKAAAIVSYVFNYEFGTKQWIANPKVKHTTGKLLDYYVEHSTEIDAASTWTSTVKSKHMVTPSLAGALYLIFGRIDEELNEYFWHSLMTGENLKSGNPMFALREALIKNKGAIKKLDATIQGAYCIKAWNGLRGNYEVKLMRWRRFGETAETFPSVD